MSETTNKETTMKTVRSIKEISEMCPKLAADIQAAYDEVMKIYVEDDGSILNQTVHNFDDMLAAEGMTYC